MCCRITDGRLQGKFEGESNFTMMVIQHSCALEPGRSSELLGCLPQILGHQLCMILVEILKTCTPPRSAFAALVRSILTFSNRARSWSRCCSLAVRLLRCSWRWACSVRSWTLGVVLDSATPPHCPHATTATSSGCISTSTTPQTLNPQKPHLYPL